MTHSMADIDGLDTSSPQHHNTWTKVHGEGTVEKLEEEYILVEYNTRVRQAKLRDDTGVANLTLWEEDIDRVSNGYVIKIQNGMIREFNGKKYFSTGFLGRLTILEIPKKYPSVLAPVRSY